MDMDLQILILCKYVIVEEVSLAHLKHNYVIIVGYVHIADRVSYSQVI